MSLSGSGAASPLGLSPEMIIDGRYRLKELLGKGGGGEVWRAREAVDAEGWKAEEAVDAEGWRWVALKVLKAPERDARGASPPLYEHDWLHEARAVSRVRCEALPKIYTVGMAAEPAVPFIAMELLDGETLEKRLDRGPLYWRKALAIAGQIAMALDACHTADVVHGDLKPHNVFLEQAQERRVLVLDFGIASLGGVRAPIAPPVNDTDVSVSMTDLRPPEPPSSSDVAAAEPIVGTPGYISPERLTGLLPTYKDDAFALGVVLHRMIAGRLPQQLSPGAQTGLSSSGSKEGSDSYLIALHRATIDGMFEPLEAAVPGTPRAVADLVARLLGPAPERPAKGELARCLREVYRRPYGRPETPYAGLEAFGEQRMGYLPGRAADVESIVRRLRDQIGLVLCGPSGVGKSSLAVAGVAARLDEEMLIDAEGWVPLVVRPSAPGGLRVVEEAAPRKRATKRAHRSRRRIQARERLLVAPSGSIKHDVPEGTLVGTLVVVDQLEEVLSLPRADQHAFCRAFGALVTRSGTVEARGLRIGPRAIVRVVATVRDDLFGRVAALPGLDRIPERNLYVVRGVDPNAAHEIVIEPLEGTGYTFERADDVDVVIEPPDGTEYTLEQAKDADIVTDVARAIERDASALPLVQFALARLWHRRDEQSRVLKAQAWKDAGGILGALGEAAQALFDSLDRGAQQAARQLFLTMFDVDGTRNVVAEATLNKAAIAVVSRLVKEGLVRRWTGENGRVVIEPLHEALAKAWPQLGRWLDEVRVERELVRDAQRDGKRWQQAGQPADMLWGETLLQNDKVLAEIRQEPGWGFVTASIAAVGRARAAAERARKRAFWVSRVLPVAVVTIVLGVALAGWWRTNQALDQRDAALKEAKANEEEAKANEAKANRSAEEARQQKELAQAAIGEAQKIANDHLQELDDLKAQIDVAETKQQWEELQRSVAEQGKKYGALTKGVVVRIGALDVTGSLPRERVSSVVHGSFGQVRDCYNQGRSNDPSLQGSVSVRFQINKIGKTMNFGSSGSKLPDAGVTSCVTQVLKSLQFLESDGITNVTTCQIILQPQSQ